MSNENGETPTFRKSSRHYSHQDQGSTVDSRDEKCHAHAEPGDNLAQEDDAKEGWYDAVHDGFEILQR